MADARHYRDAGAVHGICHAFVVEGPQVLKRAPAPDEHKHVGPTAPVFVVQRLRDAGWGVVALHGDGVDADFAAGTAPSGQPQEIPDGGSDHGDAVRVFGDGAFAFEAEITFLRQLALEGFQRQMELPFAAVLREFDHELIAAARRVHGKASRADDLLAVSQRPGEARPRAVLEHFSGQGIERFALFLAAFEPDGLEQGVFILQGKIDVPGRGPGHVRDLAAHPDVGKAAFHGILDLCGQLADGEDGHEGMGPPADRALPCTRKGRAAP